MKKFGTLILIVGIIGLLSALGMDTSVSSYGGRVHNVGLMNEQQNLLIVTIAMAVSGMLMIIFGGRNASSSAGKPGDRATRICPFCAEKIMAQAVLCRYCGRDVVPVFVNSNGADTPQGQAGMRQDGMAAALEKWQAFRNWYRRFFVDPEEETTSFVIRAVGGYLAGKSISTFLYPLIDYYFGYGDFSLWVLVHGDTWIFAGAVLYALRKRPTFEVFKHLLVVCLVISTWQIVNVLVIEQGYFSSSFIYLHPVLSLVGLIVVLVFQKKSRTDTS